jgi:hypothetical protein
MPSNSRERDRSTVQRSKEEEETQRGRTNKKRGDGTTQSQGYGPYSVDESAALTFLLPLRVIPFWVFY